MRQSCRVLRAMDSCRMPSVLRPCQLHRHKPEMQILRWRTEMVVNFWSASWSKSVAWDFGGKSVEVGKWSWRSCKPSLRMHELQISPWVFGFNFWYRVKTQSISQDQLTLQIVQPKNGKGEERERWKEGGSEGRKKEGNRKKIKKNLQVQIFSMQNTNMVIYKKNILESPSGFAFSAFSLDACLHITGWDWWEQSLLTHHIWLQMFLFTTC